LLDDEKDQKDLETKIRKELKEHGYSSVEKVETILKMNLNIEQERKKTTQYREDLNSSRVLLNTLTEQVGKRKYNEEDHSKLKNEILELNKNLDKLKGEKGSIEKDITLLQRNLKIREDLLKQQSDLILRESDINTLKQLFKGSGFVNYVSSVHLQNLCRAANERFHKLTLQKLRLEITDGNNFQIRDFLNDGQVRSVKTLSGGQTFQAALSLALALADNIQKLTNSSQNFFFLDEGFGSLDKESLQVVFETLKGLRKENRIVGVISHVEEMQQEIDTFLAIQNDKEKGSLVSTSWSNN
jgi:exonuclease SbcC